MSGSKSGSGEDKSFKARVVYDFEAADDKELTIKEGELVVVTDDSDNNWWKGSNHRGSGIFPSSFVSKDIESRGLTMSNGGSGNSSKRSNVGGNKESDKSYLVRALYDFEAAEDNELTFKAGEMIVVLDDSNENWWKGSNERGDGLFPANFVTTELNDENAEKTKDGRRRSVQFNEEVNVKILEKDPEPVTIDEEKIDKLIHLLHEADPSGEEIDSDDLIALEEQCSLMGPLIDTELEKVDKRISQLNEVNACLVEAMNMYRSLMPQDGHNYAMPQYGYIPPEQQQTMPGQQIQGVPPMYGYPQQQQPPIQGQGLPPPTSRAVQVSPGHQHYQHPPPPGHQMPPSPHAQQHPPPHQMYSVQQQNPGPDYQQQQQQPGYPGMYQQHPQYPQQQTNVMINGTDPRIQQQ